ncbi:MAG: hypothetical protein JSS31_11035 [Proteobacteria bacterium]|nr:hypothetical protein [Pseudomonadota bacterium]MBS0494467.1 hypothetical protein [Pseudomonadota bacterium]
MTETMMREIAEQIAKEQFFLQWPVYALMLAVALVVGVGAAYLGAYARKRGESFATKTDFDELLAQLKITTAVAEEVKVSMSHADWAARERRTLLRLKLEELLQAVHELQLWQDDERAKRIFDSAKNPGPSPLPKVELLTGLYFPELETMVYDFCQSHRQMSITLFKSQQELFVAEKDVAARKVVLDNFSAALTPQYQSQLRFVSAIEAKAREIMIDLVNT